MAHQLSLTTPLHVGSIGGGESLSAALGFGLMESSIYLLALGNKRKGIRLKSCWKLNGTWSHQKKLKEGTRRVGKEGFLKVGQHTEITFWLKGTTLCKLADSVLACTSAHSELGEGSSPISANPQPSSAICHFFHNSWSLGNGFSNGKQSWDKMSAINKVTSENLEFSSTEGFFPPLFQFPVSCIHWYIGHIQTPLV